MADIKIKSSTKTDYASFEIRLGAYLIDLIILSIINHFVVGLLQGLPCIPGFRCFYPTTFWLYLIPCCILVVYETFFLSLWSLTPGKRIYGLKVLTEQGKRLSFGQAVRRSLWQIPSLAVFGIGYWTMNKNSKRQAYHDKNANTIVIVAEKRKNYLLLICLSILSLVLVIRLYKVSASQFLNLITHDKNYVGNVPSTNFVFDPKSKTIKDDPNDANLMDFSGVLHNNTVYNIDKVYLKIDVYKPGTSTCGQHNLQVDSVSRIFSGNLAAGGVETVSTQIKKTSYPPDAMYCTFITGAEKW